MKNFIFVCALGISVANVVVTQPALAQVNPTKGTVKAEKAEKMDPQVKTGSGVTSGTQGNPLPVPMSKSIVCSGTKYKITVDTHPHPSVGMTGSKMIKIFKGSSYITNSPTYSSNQIVMNNVVLLPNTIYSLQVWKGSKNVTSSSVYTLPCP